METNGRIVAEMLDAWSRQSIDEILQYFTDDAICHAMPTEPLVGKAEIGKELKQIFSESTVKNFETLNQLELGDLVINERIDHFIIGGKNVDLPVAGVFEFDSNKIKLWRDYFDPAVLVPQSQQERSLTIEAQI